MGEVCGSVEISNNFENLVGAHMSLRCRTRSEKQRSSRMTSARCRTGRTMYDLVQHFYDHITVGRPLVRLPGMTWYDVERGLAIGGKIVCHHVVQWYDMSYDV